VKVHGPGIRALDAFDLQSRRGACAGPQAEGAVDVEPGAGIPRALPALVKAQRLGTKAGRVGFDWPTDEDVVLKLEEETEELRRAIASGDHEELAGEIGDALFTVTMLARRLDVDADAALARANAKFERRFRYLEEELRRRGIAVSDAPPELMERLWEEAKAR